MNSSLSRHLINKIDIYSAKKIITKFTEAYSVLNPLTNSLSPSAKSKGERFVSARLDTKNRRLNGIKIKTSGRGGVKYEKINALKQCIIIKDKHTSYEIL